jgi:hypothetical protein
MTTAKDAAARKLARPFCFECGKEVYPDQAAATAAIAEYAGAGHHRSRQLPTNAHACPSGHGWHLTSRRDRRPNGRRDRPARRPR